MIKHTVRNVMEAIGDKVAEQASYEAQQAAGAAVVREYQQESNKASRKASRLLEEAATFEAMQEAANLLETADLYHHAAQEARRAVEYRTKGERQAVDAVGLPYFYGWLHCTGRASAKMITPRPLRNLLSYISLYREEAHSIYMLRLWELACEIDATPVDWLTVTTWRAAEAVATDRAPGVSIALTGETKERGGVLLHQVVYSYVGLDVAVGHKAWQSRVMARLYERFAYSFKAWCQQATSWKAAERVQELSLEAAQEAGRFDAIVALAGTSYPQADSDAAAVLDWVQAALPEYLQRRLMEALSGDKALGERERKAAVKALAKANITAQALHEALTA